MHIPLEIGKKLISLCVKEKIPELKTSSKCSFQTSTHQLEVPQHILTSLSSLKQRRLGQQRQFTDCKKIP